MNPPSSRGSRPRRTWGRHAGRSLHAFGARSSCFLGSFLLLLGPIPLAFGARSSWFWAHSSCFWSTFLSKMGCRSSRKGGRGSADCGQTVRRWSTSLGRSTWGWPKGWSLQAFGARSSCFLGLFPLLFGPNPLASWPMPLAFRSIPLAPLPAKARGMAVGPTCSP